jgi:hypothetical protein
MSPPRSSGTELRSALDERSIFPSLSRYGSGLKSRVTTIAFWTAIVLPFLHLPLLATGLETTSVLLAFTALVALNVVAVLVGQPHRRE